MMGSRALLTILLLAGFAPGSVSAQSLGELARQEEARRKQTPSGRQYTNADLPPVPESAGAPAAVRNDSGAAARSAEDGAPAAVESAPADASAPARGREKRDETYWRSRARELRGRVQQAQTEIGPLEARLLELEAQAGTSPAALRERDVTAAHLRKVRQSLQFFVEEVDRFEKRARADRIPADWTK